MQEFAEKFYKSQSWKTTRDAYFRSKKGLCEVCLKKGMYTPGEIVHHKIHLNSVNVIDPTVSLNWDNLQLLCRACHAQQHDGKQRRHTFDQYGRVVYL